MFRTLTADLDAVPAIDTPLPDNLRLTFHNPYGLDRTFADTGVAHPAFVLDRIDKRFICESFHNVLFAPKSPEGGLCCYTTNFY